MTIAIRPIVSADVPAITRIYAHAVEHGTASFELTPPDQAEIARRMNDLTGKGYPYLAADIDGALAGYAYAGPYRARPAYRLTIEDSVYIAPEARRRGVGRTLLAALIDAAAARGYRQMIAVILSAYPPRTAAADEPGIAADSPRTTHNADARALILRRPTSVVRVTGQRSHD